MSEFATPSADGAAPATPATLSLERIQYYVWNRYVEHGPAPYPLDEDRALRFLADHYRNHPLDEDTECFYYGILAYERSFADGVDAEDLQRTALRAFDAYRSQTSADFAWDVVDDRHADVRASVEAHRRG